MSSIFTLRRLFASAIAIGVVSAVAAQAAQAAPPSCSSFASPFPCGPGTYQVCTKTITCIPGSGTVEKPIQQCAQAKCVKKTASQGPCQTGNKAADAKCAREHNMKTGAPNKTQ